MWQNPIVKRDQEDSLLSPHHVFSVENSWGSMVCAGCILALTEVLPKCVVLHTVAFTKNGCFWLILRGTVPVQCTGMCVYTQTHTHTEIISLPLQTAEYKVCPRLPHGDVAWSHITQNFSFFHRAAVAEAAVSCRQLFVRCCSRGTQLSRPLWLNRDDEVGSQATAQCDLAENRSNESNEPVWFSAAGLSSLKADCSKAKEKDSRVRKRALSRYLTNTLNQSKAY